ncbi:glycosyltransferase [Methylobacterium mesophilicum]|uniref:glycosyltransferase n=1 Tax=Methylobacterium TaxID=407 RepID=UPI0011C6FC89|nr:MULTISPECIES: glycosyltransferase [Methylobacterium]TXN39685.1 glycosyltransferase family 4 protein [Methylobacterium sp. WL7]GJE23603.1 D-inositol-3-phosphate glycosyltransferase [Methylobacterium mesophilicum]
MDGSKLNNRAKDGGLNVFVHLAFDKDPEVWRRAWADGNLVGRNDETPYGYKRASEMGCNVSFSQSRGEGFIKKVLRLGVRFILGFDLIHAINNSQEIRDADVVWTHTESQFLAVSALLIRAPYRPKIIGQVVWLIDQWPNISVVHKYLYRALIAKVDVITTHSQLNLDVAKSIFPKQRVELVRFGIPAENPTPPTMRNAEPTSVISVGNDRHRDWPTLIEAVGGNKGILLEIFSGTASRRRSRKWDNITIKPAQSNDELVAAYGRAMLAVVPLRSNLHASGITAIQEAILAGLPVIATDTGGLRSYFTDDEITYVPEGNVVALSAAIISVSENYQHHFEKVLRAQSRFNLRDLGAESYIRSHVVLSNDLMCSKK